MSGHRAKRILGHPVTGAVCRLLIGSIFIYTAAPKLLRPDEFARLAYGYRILHPELVNFVGIALPWIEFVAGAFLILGILPRSSAAVIVALLGLFIGAGFLALVRGLQIRCGCFFPFMEDHQLTWSLLVRDAIVLIIAAQPLFWPTSFVPRRRSRLEQ